MRFFSNYRFKGRPLTKREKILLLLFTVLAVTVAYWQMLILPQYHTIEQSKDKLTTQQKRLTTLLAKGRGDIPNLKAQISWHQQRLAELYERVPSIVDQPQLLVDFYQLAVQNNVSSDFIKFHPLEHTEGSHYSTAKISLELMGKNGDIYNYLRDIEEYPRPKRVEEVSFKPLDGVRIKCTLTVAFYVLHAIEADPTTYPFMDGGKRQGKPEQMFKALPRPSEIFHDASSNASNDTVFLPNEPDKTKDNSIPWLPIPE